MGTLSIAQEEIKSIIFRNQVAATKMIGEILTSSGENLCGNELETLAQYLTVIAAVKQKLENLKNSD